MLLIILQLWKNQISVWNVADHCLAVPIRNFAVRNAGPAITINSTVMPTNTCAMSIGYCEKTDEYCYNSTQMENQKPAERKW